jgi:hypothetical protein
MIFARGTAVAVSAARGTAVSVSAARGTAVSVSAARGTAVAVSALHAVASYSCVRSLSAGVPVPIAGCPSATSGGAGTPAAA